MNELFMLIVTITNLNASNVSMIGPMSEKTCYNLEYHIVNEVHDLAASCRRATEAETTTKIIIGGAGGGNKH